MRKIYENEIAKVYFNREYDEYVVKFNGLTSSAAYFTDDKQDALDTVKYESLASTRVVCQNTLKRN